MGPIECALVLVGGFLGGVLRFGISGAVARAIGETFPWGTLVVNITGAFVIGALVAMIPLAGGVLASAGFRDFVIVGILGGYTTVSSFALQSLNLALSGEAFRASLNVVLSTFLGPAFVAAGFWVAGRLSA
ncbi:fluoride efflux transporter CrcB [Vineibacter terrae]|uniref:fluoride efflux transporter CrcB n=1 Tax=Vineibacter terrae TaxID=2586908 RepID=UPI002E373D76|nr:fluoride efflux transporter CrcB [Vineibacter terrae]HEX2890878.1 fluoride efflux transporter CrcB [Vineibacter terrae]